MSEQWHPAVEVKCTSCGKIYPPDLNAGPKQWECPHCGSENTNLKGRYRVLALAYVFWLMFLTLLFPVALRITHLAAGVLVFATLLLAVILGIYLTSAPWQKRWIRVLMWVPLVAGFLIGVLFALTVALKQQAGPAHGYATGMLLLCVIFFAFQARLHLETLKALP